MKKTLAELIDSLTVINIKIFMLIEKIESGKGTVEEGQKVQLLNKQRSEYMNAISKIFDERETIKL